LSKLTFVVAVMFMVTNYTLSHLSSPDTSAMDKLLGEGNVAAETIKAEPSAADPVVPAKNPENTKK